MSTFIPLPVRDKLAWRWSNVVDPNWTLCIIHYPEYVDESWCRFLRGGGGRFCVLLAFGKHVLNVKHILKLQQLWYNYVHVDFNSIIASHSKLYMNTYSIEDIFAHLVVFNPGNLVNKVMLWFILVQNRQQMQTTTETKSQCNFSFRIEPEELYILSCGIGLGRRPRPFPQLRM